jgi:hypothetical protein
MTQYPTPVTVPLPEGSHSVTLPLTQHIAGKDYRFVKWGDESTNLTRVINLNAPLTIKGVYEVISMTTITFSGQVTDTPPNPGTPTGTPVLINVTKPDASTEQLNTVTLADKTFTVQMDYPPGVGYSAYSEIAADANYKSAQSAPVPFDVGLYDRTITLNVVVG